MLPKGIPCHDITLLVLMRRGAVVLERHARIPRRQPNDPLCDVPWRWRGKEEEKWVPCIESKPPLRHCMTIGVERRRRKISVRKGK